MAPSAASLATPLSVLKKALLAIYVIIRFLNLIYKAIYLAFGVM